MIDSHAHVMFDGFASDRDQVFRRAQDAGIVGWIEVGTDLVQSRAAVSLAQEHKNVWATVGVHPSDIGVLTDADWDELAMLCAQPRVVAIGEVGFDFYHTSPGLRVAGRGGLLERQSLVLRRFIDLAGECWLPVVFHVRSPIKSSRELDHGTGDTLIDAHEELLQLLGSYSDAERPRGVIHTYSGTAAQAERYLALGLYLSFSGVVTFKKAGETLAIARDIPLDRLLLETDTPFLTPEPYRGKRNEPAYVRFVAERIAEARGMDVAELARVTEHTTRELFGLS